MEFQRNMLTTAFAQIVRKIAIQALPRNGGYFEGLVLRYGLPSKI